MSSGTIELKTERLKLRRHRMEDAKALYLRFGIDPEMFEYSGWNPYATEEMARETVQSFLDNYGEEHFYGWAVEHDGILIGTVGAYDYDPADGSIEIGCSIERDCWGKGFASEALREVLAYLTEHEGIRRVKAWCASENMGSRRIMVKSGMRCIGTEPGALEIGGREHDKMNWIFERSRISDNRKTMIRKATPDDLPGIIRLYDEVHTREEAGEVTTGWLRDVYPVAKTAEDSISRGDMFVQIGGTGEIVGTGIINQIQVDVYAEGDWKFPAEDDEIMVLHTLVISVRPVHRGSGKEFLEFYEEFAREKGCPCLRLDTNARNAAARAFYKKHGYEEIGIVPTVFNGIPGVDLVLLEKRLSYTPLRYDKAADDAKRDAECFVG